MSHVMAQYSIRSKQDYIFRSNRVLEVVGASEYISKSWDILAECAKEAGLKMQLLKDELEFDLKKVLDAFDKNELDMVELFRGGGNETVLFADKEKYLQLNRIFSKYLLEKIPGMIPMAVSWDYSGNYYDDNKKLMKQADIEKNKMISGQSSFILPFSMMDRNSFIPMALVTKINGEEVRLTKENYKKRMMGMETRNKKDSVKILDDMVTKRGTESLLAVIHADGNNMGSKISSMLGNETDYEICVRKMRQFTRETADAFVTEGLKALEKCREELIIANKSRKKPLKESAFAYREIIADGDDMTFICNARFAMDYTRAYLNAVQDYQKCHNTDFSYSSCAGICIFHSHYPFARAYSMAEQACDDSAKNMVHVEGKIIEEGWVDFHYIHSGIGGDLDEIREHQGTILKMARPLCISGNSSTARSYDTLCELAGLLKKFSVARSDIKSIGSEFEYSTVEGKKELVRVYGHHKGLEAQLKGLLPDEELRLKMIYDLSEVYDLWFEEV